METTEGGRTSSSSFLPGVCFSVESEGMGEDILSCFWKYFWAWVRIWTRERVGIYRRRHERERERGRIYTNVAISFQLFPNLSRPSKNLSCSDFDQRPELKLESSWDIICASFCSIE